MEVSNAKPLPSEWVKCIIGWAQMHERISEIFVFGSRARGNNKPHSDLDLAVLVSGNDRSEVLAYSICMAERWRAELRNLLPVRVDLQFAEPGQDEVVYPSVVKEGRLIYARNGSAQLLSNEAATSERS